MWTFEHRITAAITQEQVWAVWTDVERWNAWDPGVSWAKLDGTFAVGTTCTLKPKDGPRVRAVITRCDRPLGFAAESHLPLCRLVFDHRVVEVSGGVQLTHRVTMTGPMTFLFRRLIGASIERDMPVAMARLVELATASRAGASAQRGD